MHWRSGILLRRDHAVEARAGQREYNNRGDHADRGRRHKRPEVDTCEGGNEIDQEKGNTGTSRRKRR